MTKDKIHYVGIRSFRKCEFLLYRFGRPFPDNQKVSSSQAKSSTQELYFLAGCLHVVVDFTIHAFGVLATLICVEGKGIARSDSNSLQCFISGTSKI